MSLPSIKSAPSFQPDNGLFTFQVLQQSSNGDYKDAETELSEYRQQVDREYRMRMESIVKGYEVKISKEQETFDLKEMKYVEEIEYLKRQLRQLANLNKNNKAEASGDGNCSLCANGHVVSHLKQMLDQLEDDHRGCLGEKSSLNARIIGLEQKLAVVEKEADQAEERYQKAKIEVKNLKAEKQSFERERREKQRQVRELQRGFQVKEMAMEQDLSRQLSIQKQLEDKIRKLQLKIIEQQVRPRQMANREYEQALIQHRQREQEAIGDRNPRRSIIQEDKVLRPRQANRSAVKTAANWRIKMEESYSDYAERKRNRGPETRSGLYGPMDSLDTFRPSLDHLDVRRLGNERGSMKYSYMS